jgi:aryl-alcohol dehydrogenase-like predicted oxidoreductase
MAESVELLRAAFDGGINFYDTARGYSDSESKLGAAFAGMRDRVIIATKSLAHDAAKMNADLERSLTELHTDYIDIYQFHLAAKSHGPGEPDGLYDAAVKAREQGRIRFIGLTAHRLGVAVEAAKSGLYDSIQFPFSHLSSEEDVELASACRANDVGFIAMKALSGGLITDAATAFAFMRRYENVVPIWGIQRRSELDEFLAFEANPPAYDDGARARVERDRSELSGSFCRGCGYCMPCAANVEMTWVARMPQVLRRMPAADFMTPGWRAKMERVNDCIGCDACVSRCPYELNPRALSRAAYDDYIAFAAQWDRAQ